MKVTSLSMRSLSIPFREAFHHAGASRAQTETVIVRAIADDIVGYGEGCPRSYVSGESVPTALDFFAQHEAVLLNLTSLEDIKSFVLRNRECIDANPAAWCAIELSLLDVLARNKDVTLEALLSLPPLNGPLTYSAVISAGSPEAFTKQLSLYLQQGFSHFKIKLSGDAARDASYVAVLRQSGVEPAQVRADANRLWLQADDAIRYINALDYPFWALEDPLRAFDTDALRYIAAAHQSRIILDEYVLRRSHLENLDGEPWILNLRVSKMGGILRSLEMIEQARLSNIPIIVGAQVGETSILTRAGIAMANASGAQLMGQEGAFGTILLEHDICSSPLMFGRGGILKPSLLNSQAGFGLKIVE